MYYKCKSETFTIGTYTGTGVAGNFVETKDSNGVARKPRRVIYKAVSGTGYWMVSDSERGDDTFTIALNTSGAEFSGQDVGFSANGFTPTEVMLMVMAQELLTYT
jgi:hypothetical protein